MEQDIDSYFGLNCRWTYFCRW